MSKTSSWVLWLSVLLVSCSAGEGSRALLVGNEGAGGAAGSGGAPFLTSDASASWALTAHFESPRPVRVTFVTLSCSERCADVVAVATGGFQPYSFRWEDGSTKAARRVCPTASTTYAVTVTDAGSASGEFKQAPQTATAPLSANVIQCPRDGGPLPLDGGTSERICISNPSIEGTPGVDLARNFDASPWVACEDGGADLASAGWFGFGIAASDGNTYARMAAQPGDAGGFVETISEPLCAPLRSGRTYAFAVDLAAELGSTSPIALEVHAGSSSCSSGERLWSSPAAGPTWKTFCATITPSTDVDHITFAPRIAASGGGALYVDHLVAVDRCP